MSEGEKETKRQKLTILQVKDVQTVGDKGAQKLAFRAKDSDEKEAWYFTFRTSLHDTIKSSINQELECDVQISSREHEGNTYIDRSVSQIFIDNQPIGGKKQGGFFRGKSPEERESIETQVAAKIGCDLLVAKIIDTEDPLGQATIAWALDKLGGTKEMDVKPQKSKSKPEPKEPEDTTEVEKDYTDLWTVIHDIGWHTPTGWKNWIVTELKVKLVAADTFNSAMKKLTSEQFGQFLSKVEELRGCR